MQDLKAMIDDTDRLRTSITSLPAGTKVIVAGEPSRFPAASRIIAEHGLDVVGCMPLDPTLGFDGKLDLDFERLGIAAVFAHLPSKGFFNAAPPVLQACHWLVEPGIRHREMGKDPHILERIGARLFDLFNALEDAPSKDCLARVLRARIDADFAFLRPSHYLEYAHPVVHAKPGDTVIDCGAFDGDSTELFSQGVGAEGRVFAIEPDGANYLKLCNRIAEKRMNNVIPLNCAIWSEPDILNISGDLASATINQTGSGAKTFATTIDQIKQTFGIAKIDVIKMDIEGVECDALRGAATTISNDKPKLMISAYHRQDDLVDIFDIIRGLRPDYRYFLGHHNYYHTETDLYCM